MGTPTTGALSARHINSELERSLSAQLAIGSNAVRSLAGVGSGPISFNDLRGRAQDDEITVNYGQQSAGGEDYLGFVNSYDFGDGLIDIGSINPSDADGATIRALVARSPSVSPTQNFVIILNGSLSQDYFSEIWIPGHGWQDSGASDVTYEVSGGLTWWGFPIFSFGVSGGSFEVIFRYN